MIVSLLFVLFIVGIIVFLIFYHASLLFRDVSVKCPKCGVSMKFIGNGTENKDKILIYSPSTKKHIGYHHIYRCPKCGTIKII